MELDHGDYGPQLFESEPEAQAALSRLIEGHPDAKGRLEVVELDEKGYPRGEAVGSHSARPKNV